MKRIVLLKGKGQYGALRLHVDCLAKAAKNMGYPLVVYDLADQEQLANLPKLLEGDNYFVLSFVGLDLRMNGKSISDMAAAPHVLFTVDQPGHQYDRLLSATSENIITFLDQTHLSWMSDFVPNCPATIAMLPPGGSVPEAVEIEKSCEEFIQKRDIPVLFTGSHYEFKKLPWSAHKGSPVGKILDAAAEIALSRDEMPLQVALKQAISSLHGDGAVAKVYPNFAPFFGMLNSVVHGTRRWKALMSLAKAKVPVHLYGNGWDRHLYRLKSFTYGGVGSMVETFDLLKKTQICLNSNTNFIAGAHERVFMAQMSGAAVVSDTSSWYRENYTDGEDISLFSWTGKLSVAEAVQTLVDDPDKLYDIATKGHQKANVHHSWENRLRSIIELVDVRKAA